jgi:hypothetical protein
VLEIKEPSQRGAKNTANAFTTMEKKLKGNKAIYSGVKYKYGELKLITKGVTSKSSK